MSKEVLPPALLLAANLTKGESVAGSANNSRLDLAAAKQSVLVRHAGESALWSSGLAITPDNIFGDGGSGLVAVLAGDRVLDTLEHGALNENFSTHPSVDASVSAVVVRVEDVGSAKANAGKTAIGVLPVVWQDSQPSISSKQQMWTYCWRR